MYQKRIVSPFQPKPGGRENPIIKDVRSATGILNFSAEIREDTDTLKAMSHIPNMIAYVCILKKDGAVVGIGRGSAVLNRMNKFVDRTVSAALNSSLIDSVVRSTRVLDTMRLSEQGGPEIGEAYRSTKYDATEGITDRQKTYLRELVQLNVEDDSEQEQILANLDSLTKEEASDMIGNYLK